jgi:hypothetical protein
MANATPQHDLDAETSALIARLALADLDELELDVSRTPRTLDEGYAFRDQAECLRSFLETMEDAQFAKSLDNALRSDRVFLDAVNVVEQAEQDDHRAALALSRGEPLPEKSYSQELLERPAFSLSLQVF